MECLGPLLLMILAFLVGPAVCKPSGIGGYVHNPICKLMRGNETLCDLSHRCPEHTKCEPGELLHDGGLEVYTCRPHTCYEEKEGMVMTNNSCPGTHQCVDAYPAYSLPEVTKVCKPPAANSLKVVDMLLKPAWSNEFCIIPKSGGRYKRHALVDAGTRCHCCCGCCCRCCCHGGGDKEPE